MQVTGLTGNPGKSAPRTRGDWVGRDKLPDSGRQIALRGNFEIVVPPNSDTGKVASQVCIALSAIRSNTGARSPGEPLIICRTSVVAVCWSRVSRSSASRCFALVMSKYVSSRRHRAKPDPDKVRCVRRHAPVPSGGCRRRRPRPHGLRRRRRIPPPAHCKCRCDGCS